jgi:hypothetical protein
MLERWQQMLPGVRVVGVVRASGKRRVVHQVAPPF